MAEIEITPQMIADAQGLMDFVISRSYLWLINCPSKVICYFTGNQKGKNADVATSYVMRIMGQHPVKEKNINPEDTVRILRFASQTLPTDKEGGNIRNTQYPEFKKRLPQSLIKKDITTRTPVMTIQCPRGGPDIFVEFVSFSQEVQAMAGTQRKSIWIDEECTKDFYEEQIPRLLTSNGDMVLTFTPVPGAIGWEFDELYERAKTIYRTNYVLSRIYKRTGEKLPYIEKTDSTEDITVIMAATDDNPIYGRVVEEINKRDGTNITPKEYINRQFAVYDDPDVIDARRFGLFRQLSGKIFKDFNIVHSINPTMYFPKGEIPYEFKHFRSIDYHNHVNWAIIWVAVSPQNEIFIYNELNPDPDRMITLQIAKEIVAKSKDYKFYLNLIDPLAGQTQVNTGFTTIEDLNRIFYQFKLDKYGTGGYWQPFDTKSSTGQDEIRKRLKNSMLVGKPFNNEIKKAFLPTIWFFHSCQQMIHSMKNWRIEEWATREALQTKDEKDKPQMRFSHFPKALEGLLKRPEVSMAKFGTAHLFREHPSYFRGAQI